MDLQDRLNDLLNDQLKELGIKNVKVANTFPDPKKAQFTLNSLPGSNQTKNYMDGSYDLSVAYELRYISPDAQKANEVLWAVNKYLETIDGTNLISSNGSFLFSDYRLDNAPFIQGDDETGYYGFLADFTITVYVENKN